MTNETVSDLSYADTRRNAPDTLRGQVDAAEDKHVVAEGDECLAESEQLAHIIRAQLQRIEHV